MEGDDADLPLPDAAMDEVEADASLATALSGSIAPIAPAVKAPVVEGKAPVETEAQAKTEQQSEKEEHRSQRQKDKMAQPGPSSPTPRRASFVKPQATSFLPTPTRKNAPRVAVAASKAQGAVPGIKEYAVRQLSLLSHFWSASAFHPTSGLLHCRCTNSLCSCTQVLHASKDQTSHEAKLLTSALRSGNGMRARREISDASRQRVLIATEEFLQTKQKQAEVYAMHAEKELVDGPANVNTAELDLEELSSLRRSLLQAGFNEEAAKMHAAILERRKQGGSLHQELEQKLFKERLSVLEQTHQEQRKVLAKAQVVAKADAEVGWTEDLAALAAEQAIEKREFELQVTRCAALDQASMADLPRELLKHRWSAKPPTSFSGVSGVRCSAL